MRLFIALWPDDTVRRALAAYPVADGVRVRSDNLHLTLAFLGEQDDALIPELVRLLSRLDWSGATLCIDRLGQFGQRGDYTLWAGTRRVPQALAELQRRMRLELHELALAWTSEMRFVPHVTLARHARAPWSRLLPRPSITWALGRPVLVRSQTTSAGARYNIVE